MISMIDVEKNKLLAKIPETTLLRWLPEIEVVEMSLGQVLQDSGTSPTHVYFPTSAMISLQYVMQDGTPIESANVGNEGIVGMSVYLGGESTLSRAIVRLTGQGYRLCAPLVKEEFERGGPVLDILLSYTLTLMSKMPISSVASRKAARLKAKALLEALIAPVLKST